LERYYVIKEKREARLLMNDARGRYRAFLAEFPGLAVRIRQHQIAAYLGFTPGSYSIALERVIETCGLIPVLLPLMAARHPRRDRDSVIVLVIFSILLALTYLHLIWAELFPPREYFNVAVCTLAALTPLGAYPWRGRGHADPA
jgi:hypothetical protein